MKAAVDAPLQRRPAPQFTRQSVRSEEDTDGLQPGYFTPAQIVSNFNTMLKGSSNLAPYLPTLG